MKKEFYHLLLASKEIIKTYRTNYKTLQDLNPLQYNVVRYPERPHIKDILDELTEFDAYEIISEEEYRNIRAYLFQALRKLIIRQQEQQS